MDNLLKHLQKAQDKVREFQQQMGRLRATGTSGGGAVQATVNGHKTLLKVVIQPEYMQPDDPTTLQDLIVAAVNLAHQAIEEKIQSEVAQHTGASLQDLYSGHL